MRGRAEASRRVADSQHDQIRVVSFGSFENSVRCVSESYDRFRSAPKLRRLGDDLVELVHHVGNRILRVLFGGLGIRIPHDVQEEECCLIILGHGNGV